ncbi:MAG: MerR family transcriptional regulator [Calditrichaeota bacterium]|nr:MerR family transcriptional regulator [Calditrichota bacterium]
MKPKPIQKLYYSISEVSEITSVKPHVLRYWETEFDELKPAKNRAGNRIYRLNDIKLIFLIKKLLYEDKFTIEGTKKKLALLHKSRATQIAMPFQKTEKENLLKSIKRELHEILDILDGREEKKEKAEEFPLFFDIEEKGD